MANKIWLGRSDTVNQIWKGTITTFTSGHTYTITLTDEAGKTWTFTHTLTVGLADTTAAASEFKDAWNNSGHFLFANLTASSTANAVSLTADTAGRPFNVSATGGTGTWSSTGNTAENSGPNDWNVSDNWFAGTVPAGNDDIVIPPNTPAILYGLDQSGTLSGGLGSFRVEQGFINQIGGGEDNAYLQLVIDANGAFEFAGTGQAWIDTGASDVDPLIRNSFLPPSGQHGLYLKGNYSNIFLQRGNVGFGVDNDDITSECDNFDVSFMSNQTTDSHLTIGKNVKSQAAGSITVVKQDGGRVIYNGESVALLNLHLTNGIFEQLGDQSINSVQLYEGTLLADSVGGISTLVLWTNRTFVDTLRSRMIRTFSTVTLKHGRIRWDKNVVTVTGIPTNDELIQDFRTLS